MAKEARADSVKDRGNKQLPAANIDAPPKSDSTDSKKNSNTLSKWQTIVGILVGLTTVLSFALDLPKRLGLQIGKNKIFLSGIVHEKDSNNPIANAWITADLMPGDTIRTTSYGTFEFYVQGESGQSIRINAGADGYQIQDEYHVLPKAIAIELKKK